MVYKFNGSSHRKKGIPKIKLLVLIVIIVIYVISNNYITKSDNEMITDNLTVENAKN